MTPEEIYTALLEHYGKPRWWSEDPYTVMFQAVLVQNTAWTNVEKTTEAIGSRLSPGYISALSDEELGEAIRSCGFFRAKAKTIRTLTEWFGKSGFRTENAGSIRTPELRKELLSLKGIGEETADVILVYAFRRPSFIIDAYTHRFISRLGIRCGTDEELRLFFENGLGKDAELYGYFHWLILEHGKAHCRKTPLCQGCPFIEACRNWLESSRRTEA